MTSGAVDSKERATPLSVWQINAEHVCSLAETLDSALLPIPPTSDKIA